MKCEVTQAELRELLEGASQHDPDSLPEPLRELSEHVSRCSKCQRSIAQMIEESSSVGGPIDHSLTGEFDSLPTSRLDALKQQSWISSPGQSFDPDDDFSNVLDPPSVEGELGTIHPYRVQTVLGRGGMAVVFAAWDVRLHRRVAIKMLCQQRPDETARRRFVREARAVAAIDHPNVVPVFEVIERSDRPSAFVMPLMSGGTLAGRLQRGPLELREAVSIAAQIGCGLEAAHHAGLIHRDIKPANILFDDQSTAQLADFGLVHDRNEILTAENVIPGTPEYICPEQIRDGRSSEQSDVYQLGMTLYAMCTGRPAFQGECAQVLHQIVTQRPKSPHKLRRDIDRDLDTILMTALEKEEEHRYATAAEMRRDMEAWLQGRPVSVVRRGPIARTGFWMKKHPMAACLVTIIPTMLILMLTISLWFWQQSGLAQQQLAEQNSEVTRLEQGKQAADKTVALMQSQVISNVIATRTVQMPTRRELQNNLILKFAQMMEVGLEQSLADPESQVEIGTSALGVATLYARAGQHEKAAPLFELSLRSMREELGTPTADNDPGFEQSFAVCHRDAAVNLLRLGNPRRAKALSIAADSLYTQLLDRNPDDLGLLLDDSLNACWLAEAQVGLGELADARTGIAAITARLVQLQPRAGDALGVATVFGHYVQACGDAADVCEQLSMPEEAETLRQLVVGHYERNREQSTLLEGNSGFEIADHAQALIALAHVQQRREKTDDALASARQAAEMLRQGPPVPDMPQFYEQDREEARQLIEILSGE